MIANPRLNYVGLQIRRDRWYHFNLYHLFRAWLNIGAPLRCLWAIYISYVKRQVFKKENFRNVWILIRFCIPVYCEFVLENFLFCFVD